MKRLFLIVAVVGAMLATSCNTRTMTTPAFYSTTCEYLNTEADGSITVRAYGQGRNRIDAREQARKNAVREVILKGVNVPGNTLMSRPLVFGANAEEKIAPFLNEFFRDGGAYTMFISLDDRRVGSNEKHWGGAQMKISTTVRVYRAELEQYLRDNNIIK